MPGTRPDFPYPQAKSLLLAAFLVAGVTACAPSQQQPDADYVVTLPPLKMILEPLVRGRKTVESIVPPGISPHTFTLRPSDARRLAGAKAVFIVDPSLDGWAVRGAGRRAHEMLGMVPESMRLPYTTSHIHEGDAGHRAGEENAHFWSDPVVVSAVVSELVETLVALDPAGRAQYETNAAAFHEVLSDLDEEIRESMAALPPLSVVAFHPSWSYFYHRYGIDVAAYVEPIPGKEPTPRTIQELRDHLAGKTHVMVLSEVQLARKSADALAEALGARVGVLDPLGGAAPLETYEALLRHNADRLREAAQ